MTNTMDRWAHTLIHLLALAFRLEGAGQYNLAKLARAAVDSMGRRSAYQLDMPTDKEKLAAEVKQMAEALPNYGVSTSLSTALRQGADIMAKGRLPLIDVAPHAYVCRICGHLVLDEPAGICPTCGAWPSTFQLFPPVYWLDALDPFEAMKSLRQTPIEVEKLVAGLSESALNRQPEEGGWTIRNTLSHLRDAQGVLDFRLDLFLREEHPVLESKAVFSWATKEDGRPPSARDIFEAYRASRQGTIDKLKPLPLVAWWQTGSHEEFGTVTLGQQVSYFAAHEMTHLRKLGLLRRRFVEGAPSASAAASMA